MAPLLCQGGQLIPELSPSGIEAENTIEIPCPSSPGEAGPHSVGISANEIEGQHGTMQLTVQDS